MCKFHKGHTRCLNVSLGNSEKEKTNKSSEKINTDSAKDGFVMELASECLQDEQEYYWSKRRRRNSRQRNPQEQRPINITVQDLGQEQGAVLWSRETVKKDDAGQWQWGKGAWRSAGIILWKARSWVQASWGDIV